MEVVIPTFAQWCKERLAESAPKKQTARRRVDAVVENAEERAALLSGDLSALSVDEMMQAFEAHEYLERERSRERRRNGVGAAYEAVRRAAKTMAFPKWADRRKISAIYALAAKKTMETGRQYHVDHKVPLQGKFVSGLHVHQNLRVVLQKTNLKKSNKFKT